MTTTDTTGETNKEPQLMTFRERSDLIRQRCRMGRFRSNGGRPFVKEASDSPKGKKAIRAAKRERVRAMKAAQQLNPPQA